MFGRTNGWMDCQWGVALLHAGHNTGLKLVYFILGIAHELV
jgi:hypothetical protein